MDSGVVMAFVGAVVPDQPAFHGPAFSRAGNMSQENLLTALREAGLSPSLILSQRPLRLFPKSGTLWASGGWVSLPSGLSVNLVPFLNFSLLRPASVGLAVISALARWGWRQRHVKHKVVYTFNLTEPPGLLTLVAARLIGARAVAFINDINVPGETVPDTLLRRLDFWLTRKLIPRFDGLVVVSDRIVEDFAPDSTYVRVEGGVRREVLQRFSSGLSKLEKADDYFTIVSAGSLTEENGVLELLEAFSLLPNRHYRLLIAGAGPLETIVKQAAEQDPRIEYRGYLSFDEVLALYKVADVLINMRLTRRLNTRYFFPSKLLEYLASGIPVITTCTGHVEEEYAEVAFLLYDESPQGLARMIEHVASLEPEIRAHKGKAARDYIETHKTWEAQGRRVVEFICRKVLNCDKV